MLAPNLDYPALPCPGLLCPALPCTALYCGWWWGEVSALAEVHVLLIIAYSALSRVYTCVYINSYVRSSLWCDVVRTE